MRIREPAVTGFEEERNLYGYYTLIYIPTIWL